MKPKPPENGRVSPPTLRRQFNESFCDPYGHLSITKTVAIAAQVTVLFWMGKLMDKLIDKPETLLIMLSFLVAPDLVKKFLAMKLGGATAAK